jgi:hypothetical protein
MHFKAVSQLLWSHKGSEEWFSLGETRERRRGQHQSMVAHNARIVRNPEAITSIRSTAALTKCMKNGFIGHPDPSWIGLTENETIVQRLEASINFPQTQHARMVDQGSSGAPNVTSVTAKLLLSVVSIARSEACTDRTELHRLARLWAQHITNWSTKIRTAAYPEGDAGCELLPRCHHD